MGKIRNGICGWCSQKIESRTKNHENLKSHLEVCHLDFKHKGMIVSKKLKGGEE